ncbi:MAG: hypothetical protein AB8B59_17870 [Maribacter sp.]
MKNSIKIMTTLVMVLWAMNMSAQRPGRDRIKTLKVSFITEQLALTTGEAQKFWPIYNAHDEQLEEIRTTEREKFVGIQKDLSIVSDSEAEKMVQTYIRLQTEKQVIEEKFIKDLQNVISAKKIILLFRAENNFKKRLLQQMRKRRTGQ